MDTAFLVCERQFVSEVRLKTHIVLENWDVHGQVQDCGSRDTTASWRNAIKTDITNVS